MSKNKNLKFFLLVVIILSAGFFVFNQTKITKAAAPAAPSSAWSTNVSYTTMTWNWNGVSGNHHFEAQYKINGAVVWSNVSSGLPAAGCPSCSWNMTGGTQNTEAYFQVRACNSSSQCSSWTSGTPYPTRFLATCGDNAQSSGAEVDRSQSACEVF